MRGNRFQLDDSSGGIMRNLGLGLFVLVLLAVPGNVSAAQEPVSVASGRKVATRPYSADREPSQTRSGGWLASMGVGLFFNPGLFLLNPQLEYAMRHNFYIGPMVQLGLGSGTLFTGSFTGRFLFGHTRVKPAIEGGLGMGFASGGAVGLHIPLGVGVDYQLERGIAIGTMFRANIFIGSSFANTLVISWPILVGRFAI